LFRNFQHLIIKKELPKTVKEIPNVFFKKTMSSLEILIYASEFQIKS